MASAEMPPTDLTLDHAYDAGSLYALGHDHRPCLGGLGRVMGYSEAEALFFALGFFEAKQAMRQQAESRCGCAKGGS